MLRDHESRFRLLWQEIPALRRRPPRISLDLGLIRRVLLELDDGIPGLLNRQTRTASSSHLSAHLLHAPVRYCLSPAVFQRKS